MPRNAARLAARASLVAVASIVFSAGAARAQQPMSSRDLLAVKWVSQVSLSPDGKLAAFVLARADVAENKRASNIYLVETSAGATPKPRQVTSSEGSNTMPAFSPDGRRLAFISSRGGGVSQIYLIQLDGGEAVQLTRKSSGAGGPLVWSSDGKLIAFTSQVYPACAAPQPEKVEACNKQRLEAEKKSKVQARVYDGLLVRHWNTWRDERRTHIFVVPAEGGTPRDVTPGPHDAPTFALGGGRDIAFSPDSRFLAYVKNVDPSPATSTNNDVFEVPLAGGPEKPISKGKGNDNTPRYSPDGRYLAYLSMERAGYESDRPRIIVRERRSGKEVEWSRGFDGHPVQMEWSADSQQLYFTAPHQGQMEIFVASPTGVRQLSRGLYAKYLNVAKDGKQLVFTHEAADMPPEVHLLPLGGGERRALTSLNSWMTKKLGFRRAEAHWFEGAGGKRVHGVLVKPPGFRAGKRYPAMVMIHGGPQGMTGDSFHPRWNLQMFASRGYVVFGVNFHGSVGFGQELTDSINDDWGGKPFQDVIKSTDYLARLPFVDGKKICAAGASYGGYLINWIATQTQRFRCLISHAGVYNLESKYGSTEELWFPEWEYRGTPWSNRPGYQKWSPHMHAERIRTPTLVIHGQRDYRVPVEQGLQMFTALQRQGVASRLLYFPDEDHFVQKPQNIELWWATMHDWLGRYLR